jgi:L-alanine-DL-glutamate epimerase-like enolase superfamily enzyme
MKITVIEAFQVAWSPTDRPQQHSAFVLVHTDTGLTGMGEASPMQGGRASLGMIREDIAPMLIGQDPLDHAVLLDQALHTLVKLGPEGRADRGTRRARHRAVGPQGQADRPADPQAHWRRLEDGDPVLCLDRRQRGTIPPAAPMRCSTTRPSPSAASSICRRNRAWACA